MERSVVCRIVAPDECVLLDPVNREWPEPERLARTIYGAAGATRYLADTLTAEATRHDHLVMGAWVGDTLVGYTHWRALPQAWHLNFIGVRVAFRSQGVGQALWEAGCTHGRSRGYTQLSLDVERRNVRVQDWYVHSGLQISGSAWTYEINADDDVAAPIAAEVLDREDADQRQQRYGFSQFHVLTGETWTVDRLGDEYVRVRRLPPLPIRCMIRQLEPTRRLILLSPEPIEHPDLITLDIYDRMQGTPNAWR